MSWRTVVISSNSKLDLKLGYMVIRNSDVRKVHLSEISVLMLESTAVSITSMLMCELVRRNVKIILCDEAHNPLAEVLPLHGSHDSPGKLRTQIDWDDDVKKCVWAEIIKKKITCQANLLDRFDYERAEMLREYSNAVEAGDSTNREGHAAKVYFNTLFGEGFSRRNDCSINAHLNYGYAIVHSAINREIASLGYSTELGIFHDNMFNHFNLGSDLIEPIRPVVDRMVLELGDVPISTDSKRTIARVLEEVVTIDGRSQYLVNALRIYVKSVMDALESEDTGRIRFCDYENKSNETHRILRSADGNDG